MGLINVSTPRAVTIQSVIRISSSVCENSRASEIAAMKKPKMKSTQVILKVSGYRKRKTNGDIMSQMPSTRFVQTKRFNFLTPLN